MKKLLFLALIPLLFVVSCKKDDVYQEIQTPSINPSDTAVMFTLYSKRVPYIWKRVVNGQWVQDTIKINNAVRFEPYDIRNMGVGYWVTMNLQGIPTDSLHIRADYKGKHTEMSSLPQRSAAYVLLDDIQP